MDIYENDTKLVISTNEKDQTTLLFDLENRHNLLIIGNDEEKAGRFSSDIMINNTNFAYYIIDTSYEKEDKLVPLEMKMDQRNKIIAKDKCNNWQEYNEKHPENKMAKICLLMEDFKGVIKDSNFKALSKIEKDGQSAGCYVVIVSNKNFIKKNPELFNNLITMYVE